MLLLIIVQFASCINIASVVEIVSLIVGKDPTTLLLLVNNTAEFKYRFSLQKQRRFMYIWTEEPTQKTAVNWVLASRYTTANCTKANRGCIVVDENTSLNDTGTFKRCPIAEKMFNPPLAVSTTPETCTRISKPTEPPPPPTLVIYPPRVQNGTCYAGPTTRCQPLSGSVVFTTLFTKYSDATGPRKMDPYHYIEPWYKSIHAVGMHGIVLYDVLSQDFISSHSTHAIIFRKTEEYISRTPNDRRFYIYRDILRAEHQLSVCVFSDGRDVRFQRNVFDYIVSETLRDTTKSALFVGLDVRTVGKHNWLRQCDKGEFSNGTHATSNLLNAGFLGCTRIACLAFLDVLTAYLDRFKVNGNCNMLSFNRAAYDLVDSGRVRIVTNKPLINRLFDNHKDDEIYVMHKGYVPHP